MCYYSSVHMWGLNKTSIYIEYFLSRLEHLDYVKAIRNQLHLQFNWFVFGCIFPYCWQNYRVFFLYSLLSMSNSHKNNVDHMVLRYVVFPVIQRSTQIICIIDIYLLIEEMYKTLLIYDTHYSPNWSTILSLLFENMISIILLFCGGEIISLP